MQMEHTIQTEGCKNGCGRLPPDPDGTRAGYLRVSIDDIDSDARTVEITEE